MLHAHDAIRGQWVGGESCEQFEYPGKVWAEALVVELPSRKPRSIADGSAEELTACPKPVDGLRCAEPQQRLHVGRRHRSVDEVLDQRGAALCVQLVGGYAFEGSLRGGRCGENGIKDPCESGVPLSPGSDLTSERGDGGSHSDSLRSQLRIETIETSDEGTRPVSLLDLEVIQAVSRALRRLADAATCSSA